MSPTTYMNPIALRRSLLQHISSLFSPRSSSTMPKPTQPSSKLLTRGSINPLVENFQYAVRGELVTRAEALAKTLQSSPTTLPFSRITFCNIGNPQSVGQQPITYVRQVLALVTYPALITSSAREHFPSDVLQRAQQILASAGSLGAYSESKGVPELRERIANAIQKRDQGAPCHPDSIFLTNGASEGAKLLLQMIIRSSDDGVLIPIPQYPLYSATMASLDGAQIPYYLDESNEWSLSLPQLNRSLHLARQRGVNVRAIVVINPGNPTGQVLSKQNLVEIVQFCEREHLVLLADEVYQNNVYADDKPFVSFKRVVSELQSDVELVSFHSVSKGMLGECGLRGGYLEAVNVDSYASDMLYKLLSVSLCSNLIGQVAVDLMMTPPSPGDDSYQLYQEEMANIYGSLKRKAAKMSTALNTFQGVTCNASQGAMYLFPKITIPERAIDEATRRGMASSDTFYCVELLEATGICVVPGSGFGQQKGTFHFRTTFLPPEDQIDEVLEKMRTFHEGFMLQYSN